MTGARKSKNEPNEIMLIRFHKSFILDRSVSNVFWINPDIDPTNPIKYELLLQD